MLTPPVLRERCWQKYLSWTLTNKDAMSFSLSMKTGLALSQASDYSEAIILAKAAKILRRHMLDHTSKFDGTFHDGCIEEAIPSSLLQFVGMIEHGADIKSQLRFGVSKTDLVIAQLLQYNCYAKYKEGAATHRHSTNLCTCQACSAGGQLHLCW